MTNNNTNDNIISATPLKTVAFPQPLYAFKKFKLPSLSAITAFKKIDSNEKVPTAIKVKNNTIGLVTAITAFDNNI